MKKKSSKRGLIAMLFVTVLAIVIALSARMLKGTEVTYAASTNNTCARGKFDSSIGKCVVTKTDTHTNNKCATNGSVEWATASNADQTSSGWYRADRSEYPSISKKYPVEYYVTRDQLSNANVSNPRPFYDYYGNEGAIDLCKELMTYGGGKHEIFITAKMTFYKLEDPVSKDPDGAMTKDQCMNNATDSNNRATGSGNAVHCMQYTCENGVCKQKNLTEKNTVVCANGNKDKWYDYASLSNSNKNTCVKLDNNKDGISGTFYCTRTIMYNCNETSKGIAFVEKEKPTYSTVENNAKYIAYTPTAGENVVQHYNKVVCKGGVWSQKETSTGTSSATCPSGYKRVDYEDGFLVKGSSTGECKSDGMSVQTGGTCIDNSTRACVFKTHYKCVPDTSTYEDEKLKTLKPSDLKITGIPQYVKVGDEFAIYVQVPKSIVSNFDTYKIKLEVNNRSILNQSWGEHKLDQDNSIVVFPMKAYKTGHVKLTIGVKNVTSVDTMFEFDIHEIRQNDSKLGKTKPTCQIKIMDTAPATVWSHAKYLKVEHTNPDEVTLSDTNPFLWNDGRTVDSRAVTSLRDYSVTVTGLNGQTGKCDITAEELGKLETTQPHFQIYPKATKDGVITFSVADNGGSGLDSYYIQKPGEETEIITTVDNNGFSHDYIYTRTYNNTMSEEGVRTYGYKFTECLNDGNNCSVTHYVRESGTYYVYVLDKANNVTKQVVNVQMEGTPYIDSISFVGDDITGSPVALMDQTSYGSKLIRLSNNYQTDSLVKQMAFTFDKTKTEYNVNTSSSTITLYATLKTTDKNFVKGFEPPAANTPLKYGENIFTIKVEDKKGRVTAYTIRVNRVDDRSGLNVLESLTVGSSEIDFNENRLEYDVDVAKDITQVSLNAILKSTSASFVDGFGPRIVDLPEDETTAQIKVKSEAGSVRIYTIRFHKVDNVESGSATPGKKPVTSAKGSNYLSSLAIPGTNIALDKDRLIYNVYVPYTTLNVPIYAFAEDPQAKVVIDAPTSLRVGSNTATVSVVSTENKTRTYTITIIRKEDELGISSNTKLGSLEVLGYDIGFDRNKTNYELKIDKEKNLFIAATPESDRSEVYIIGNEDLTTFSTVKLSVIAEDGSEDVYSVQISKDVWNVKNEIIITVVGLAVVIGVTVIYNVRRKKKLKTQNID